jgi:hypothetical protein
MFQIQTTRIENGVCFFHDILDMKWAKNRLTSFEFHDILVKKS